MRGAYSAPSGVFNGAAENAANGVDQAEEINGQFFSRGSMPQGMRESFP
jgi:hypothetical protein